MCASECETRPDQTDCVGCEAVYTAFRAAGAGGYLGLGEDGMWCVRDIDHLHVRHVRPNGGRRGLSRKGVHALAHTVWCLLAWVVVAAAVFFIFGLVLSTVRGGGWGSWLVFVSNLCFSLPR